MIFFLQKYPIFTICLKKKLIQAKINMGSISSRPEKSKVGSVSIKSYNDQNTEIFTTFKDVYLSIYSTNKVLRLFPYVF